MSSGPQTSHRRIVSSGEPCRIEFRAPGAFATAARPTCLGQALTVELEHSRHADVLRGVVGSQRSSVGPAGPRWHRPSGPSCSRNTSGALGRTDRVATHLAQQVALGLGAQAWTVHVVRSNCGAPRGQPCRQQPLTASTNAPLTGLAVERDAATPPPKEFARGTRVQSMYCSGTTKGLRRDLHGQTPHGRTQHHGWRRRA
jgi:hypothetical protein